MISKIRKLLIAFVFLLVAITVSNCKEELTGTEKNTVAPTTRILNIPVPNTTDNLYEPYLEVGWQGISENSIIAGFWVSWKSYYLLKNEIVTHEPYFTKEASQNIAFPSADSINKHVLYVRAVDQNGTIDEIGDSVTFYTSKTIAPVTSITFPSNNASALFLDKASSTWKGIKIVCNATTSVGEIEGFSLRIDGGNWSEWQSDSLFTLTKKSADGVTEGRHKIEVISRNTALVEDPTPAEIYMNFVYAPHPNEWLIIDDTRNQNGGTEKPSDEQVDQFYETLLAGIQHDNWDIITDGMITREKIGQYKYVLWHCDDKGATSLPSAAGIITDYLNTKGRLLVSGWNYLSYFTSSGNWADSTQFYGNILTDYFHINKWSTINDALLDSVIIYKENYLTYNDYAEIDTSKLYSFRNGLFQIINMSDRGAFTESLFGYHAADTIGTNHTNKIIGLGYHNPEYQLVVSGFPLYYLTEDGAKKVFLRAKEFLEKNFLY